MSKVLDFSAGLEKANGKSIGKLDYDQLGKYFEYLHVQCALMKKLAMEIEAKILEAEMNPADFNVKTSSARDYVGADIMEFMEGQETLELSYTAEIDGYYYEAAATARYVGEELDLNCILIKMGNGEIFRFSDGEFR